MNQFKPGQPVKTSDGKRWVFLQYGVPHNGLPRPGIVYAGRSCAVYPLEMITEDTPCNETSNDLKGNGDE